MASLTVPIALDWNGTAPFVVFGSIDVDALGQPFWQHTLETRMRRVSIKPLDSLPEGQADDASRLAGMIFHMGRCGSTLICRQLDTLPRVIALSEPFVFQQLLEGPAAPTELTERRLRRLLHAHTSALTPHADHIVIKWPLLVSRHARRITRAFTGVPSIYLYRDPVEVLHAASTSAETIASVQNFDPEILRLPDRIAEHSAYVGTIEKLARIIAAGSHEVAQVPSIKTLSYSSLPIATWELVAPCFKLPVDTNRRGAMMVAAQTHSKATEAYIPFRPDGAGKRHRALNTTRFYAETIIAPVLTDALSQLSSLAQA